MNEKETNNVLVLFAKALIQWFFSMKKWVQSVLVVALIFGGIVYPFSTKIADLVFNRYLEPTDDDLDKLVNRRMKEEAVLKRKADSLSVRLSEINVANWEEIRFEAFRLEKHLENCIAVNWWTMHNGGETPKSDGKWYLEVYISSRQKNYNDFKPNIDKNLPPIYDGFRWLAIELQKSKWQYFDDITKYPDFYVGEAKTHMDISGVKSTIGAFVVNKGKIWHYVTFDFDTEYPMDASGDLYKHIDEFKDFVKERI